MTSSSNWFNLALERARTVPMSDIATMLGLGPIRGRKIRSPFHEDKTPSLHLYQYDWYDYSTGKGGDQLDLVQAVTGWTWRKAVDWIARGAAITAVRRDEPEEQPADLTEVYRFEPPAPAHHVEAFREMVEDRWGLDLYQLQGSFGVRVVKDHLWVPHFQDEICRGIKTRTLDGRKAAVTGSQFTHTLYSNGNADRWRDRALLVEGESDCWVAELVADVPTWALPSGAGLWREHWWDHLPETVYLCLDDDDAGRTATRKIFEQHPERVVVLRAPGGRLAEAVQQGWDLSGEIRRRSLTF